jgi:hypothetical protein
MASERDSYTGPHGREQKYKKYATSKSRRNFSVPLSFCTCGGVLDDNGMCRKCGEWRGRSDGS